MKKYFKFLLCLMLILSISCSFFCVSASASNVFYLSTADYCNGIIVYEFYSDIYDSGFSQAQGSFAPGLVYDHSGNFLIISGNPTAPGEKVAERSEVGCGMREITYNKVQR